MRRYYRVIVCALLLGGVSRGAAADAGLALEDAIRIGLENNFAVRIARNRARVAGNGTGKGTAAFLPTIDATGNYTRSNVEQTTNSPFSFGDSDTESWGAEVSFSWTLFDGFRMFADRKRYAELARLGEAEARNLIETSVVQISAAYFDLIQQEQLLEVAVETRDISRTRFDREQVRSELGGSSSTDRFNAQVALNNDQAALLNQELRTDVASQSLNLLLGRDPATPTAVSRDFQIPALSTSYEEILARAEQSSSALHLAVQNSRVADQDVKLRRSVFMPRLSLNGAYGYSDRTVTTSSRDITTEERNARVGLLLTYNLFNGKRDHIDLQNAQLAAENRRLELENARNELKGLVRERQQTFERRMTIIALEEQNLEAAERNLQLQLDRFELGVATSLEFRDAQLSLARARNALIVARYQARLARLDIEQITGEIPVE